MKWEERPLGEVLYKDVDCVAVTPGVTYEMTGVLSFGKGLFRKPATSGDSSSYSTFYRLHQDQLVMSQLFGWEGALALVTEPFVETHVSSQFPTFRTKPDSAEIKYIGWAIRQPSFWQQLAAKAVGMGVRRRTLNPEALLSCKLPLPPVKEQRKIVAKLDAAAERIARIEAAQSANAGDFDRVLQSEFHRITSDAPRRPMREVAPLVRRPVKIEDDKEYPELGVRSFGRGTFHKPALTGSMLTWQKLFRIHAGDIVISNIKAWEGAIAICSNEDGGRVGSHRYLTYVPSPDLLTANWLRFFLLTTAGLAQVGECSPGSADRNRTLGTKAFEKVLVPLPQFAEQQAFDSLCQKFARLRAAQDSRAADLTALMPSLLDRAFKGEL